MSCTCHVVKLKSRYITGPFMVYSKSFQWRWNMTYWRDNSSLKKLFILWLIGYECPEHPNSQESLSDIIDSPCLEEGHCTH